MEALLQESESRRLHPESAVLDLDYGEIRDLFSTVWPVDSESMHVSSSSESVLTGTECELPVPLPGCVSADACDRNADAPVFLTGATSLPILFEFNSTRAVQACRSLQSTSGAYVVFLHPRRVAAKALSLPTEIELAALVSVP